MAPDHGAPAIDLRVTYAADGEGWAIAAREGVDVAMLRWDYLAEPPVVIDMSVDEQHRRQGIGTALFGFARRHESQLQHSEVLTAEGSEFVRALDGT